MSNISNEKGADIIEIELHHVQSELEHIRHDKFAHTTNQYEMDAAVEKRIVRKLDFTLLPLMTLIYTCNIFDRTAIGNANIAGFQANIGLVGYQYNIALTIFYLVYIASEIPSNLILKRVGGRWVACLTIMFGIVSMCTAFIHNFGGLIATRIFLGIGEGGNLPGIAYILSRFYRRQELAYRIGFFLAVGPSLGGAFGGLLASGILAAGNMGTVTSWRKIFLIEGLVTTCLGIACLWLIPSDPETTRLFTEQERIVFLGRMKAENAAGQYVKEPTTLKGIISAFNTNSLVCGFCYTLTNISVQGLSLFMPVIIATLGKFTTVESQLRTVPPYVVGTLWGIAVSYASMRFERRGIFVMISSTLSITGYALFVASNNANARYAACFLGYCGAIPMGPLWLSWATNNAAPETTRAITTALIPTIGTFGSVIATWTYLPNDAPNYHHGNSLNLATNAANCVIAALLIMYNSRENKKRERGERDHRLDGLSPEQEYKLGNYHPRFRMQT